MLLNCCFYVGLAFLGVYLVKKFHVSKGSRRVYTREQMLEQQGVKIGNEGKNEILIEKKEESLEAFILKEIEKSVKSLERKREPFKDIDTNVMVRKFDPQVEEYVPKRSLNPFAQDFYPNPY